MLSSSMRMLLLLHGVAALSTRTIAPPAAPVLDNIVHLAQRAVAAPEFLDPRDGTWADCPVGGAAERDGSWLDIDTRAALKAALDGLAARDRHGLAARLAGEGSACLDVASGERYSVQVLALEAGGVAVRETHPSGTVVVSRCVAGRCSAVPMLRLKNDRPWEPRVSSARTRRRDGGCWTSLGGPPRETSCAGARPALVVSVALKPPVEQSIALDGGTDDARRGELREEDAAAFVLATETDEDDAPPPSPLALSVSDRVGGLDAVVSELSRRLLASRLAGEAGRRLGVKHARGALLYGPPGCGKTLLARELGRALGVEDDRISIVNGPELLDKFVGVAEARVRGLFERSQQEWARYRLKVDGGAFARDARAVDAGLTPQPPLNVVIFDEIDAVCRERGTLTGDTTGVRDGVTAQLMACLDGVEDAGNVVVVATTNRPELLDRALLRPGRLEIQIFVPPPDAGGRRAVWDVHACTLVAAGALADDAKRLIDDPVFFADSGATENFSGAEIEGLVRALASYALERASAGAEAVVTAQDVRSALADVVSDRAASKKAASIRDAAWTELAELENKWTGGPPADREEVLAFLERRAYDVRDVSLPLRRRDVEDLVAHLYRYLRRE